jgi:hypothetical protein
MRGRRSTVRTVRGRLVTGAIVQGVRCRFLAGTVAVAVLAVFTPAAWAGFGFPAEGGLEIAITNQNGTPDLQAGSHPFAYTTSLAVNTEDREGKTAPADGDVKDVEVSLPPGLVGDPLATAQCTQQEFRANFTENLLEFKESCPDASQIGILEANFGGLKFYPEVYNLVPQQGYPAEFGFRVLGVPVVIVPRVRTGSDYGVTATLVDLPDAFTITASKLTLWGVPADPGHDSERGPCWGSTGYFSGVKDGGECPTSGISRPFLSLPTSCSGPLQFSARVDSYENPGVYSEAKTTTPALTGCEKLGFAPDVVAQPEPAQAASPSGLSVEIQVPQTYDNSAGLAESNLKDTTVTLPAGVAVNPSAGGGLAGCSEEQFALHNASEPVCPDASKIGSVEITTPLLTDPLRGSVYLAQQGNLPGNGSNPFGSLLAIYLTVSDPQSGVLVKLAGEVTPDPATGQLVTRFLNNPQVPFNSLRLSFFAGPRAALVNPPLCGSYTTSTEMTPWSGGAPATPAWTFAIDSGPAGSPCTTTQPFSPQLVSGTVSNQAGSFTPFSLTFDRSDGEQNLARIQVTTPPGLLGTLTGVTLCGEPQAQQGTCGPESLIGQTTVGVGAGSNPYYVTGKVYLTGSYNGAPYGLSFVVPAIAGPLNLGTVVVRAAVSVDPHTAALTVTSEPLPQILQGVPLHIRAVNVTLDREHFIFNPTNCNPLSINATLTSALGASVPVSTRFQATNCTSLSFQPKLSVTTSGETSRVGGASLDARLQIPGGAQANIARVKVELPKALPSRLTTLQKACAARTFETNPAGCPQASVVGYAKAVSPLLPVTLTGPAYFVSHGGEAFPSLIVVLEGYGVRVDLVGSTFISKKGITSSTFASVPDVPVNTFELYLPEGPYSALAANGDLCKQKLRMGTELAAQNGAVIHQSTPVGVTGCTKPKAKKATNKTKTAKPGRTAGAAERTAGRARASTVDKKAPNARSAAGAYSDGRATQ